MTVMAIVMLRSSHHGDEWMATSPLLVHVHEDRTGPCSWTLDWTTSNCMAEDHELIKGSKDLKQRTWPIWDYVIC